MYDLDTEYSALHERNARPLISLVAWGFSRVTHCTLLHIKLNVIKET